MNLAVQSPPSIEALLQEWEQDAATLKRHGQLDLATQLEQVALRVREAAEEWLDVLTETEASLFSGQSTRWLAQRFESFARRGLAFKRGRARMYRRCALPRRPALVAAYVAGQEAARLTRSGSQ